MVLLIDNYDSFSYNLYQLVGGITQDIKVIRNDEMTPEEIENLHPSHIILSPGPGRPDQAGICEDVIRYFKGKVPIMGVCLGHQAICEVFGANVTYAKQLMHGKKSTVTVKRDGAASARQNPFTGLPDHLEVARYHSLAAEPDSIPEELEVMAVIEDGEIMAVGHREYPIYGLQFHPESILTKDGKQMMENFLKIS